MDSSDGGSARTIFLVIGDVAARVERGEWG
jgi:hypothetical protein